jgi:hypothetical protein
MIQLSPDVFLNTILPGGVFSGAGDLFAWPNQIVCGLLISTATKRELCYFL